MPKTANPYSVHPGVRMIQDWVAGLKPKTGRSLEEWIAFIRKQGPNELKAAREWLRKQGLSPGDSLSLAERAFDASHHPAAWEDGDAAYLREALDFVQAQYAGKKAHLRPLYEALLNLGLGVGRDVRACPCQTMVPLYRKHVFAQIKPTTNSRIDFGFCLRGVKAKGRLKDTGGEKKGDRITHRIEIAKLSDIDAEVKKWVKQAYDADA